MKEKEPFDKWHVLTNVPLPEDIQAETLLGTTRLSTFLVNSKTFNGPLDFENCLKLLIKHNWHESSSGDMGFIVFVIAVKRYAILLIAAITLRLKWK